MVELRESIMARPIKKRIYPNGLSKKKFTPTKGIYEIRHLPSQRRYVGSSIEVERRLFWHLSMLRAGKHHCKYLQNVWNKYPEEDFACYLLEVCKEDSELETREQFYMDQTEPGKSMNLHPAAGSGRGYKMSEETKKKMSDRAKIAANTPEQKKMRSERAKRQHATGNIPYRKRGLSPKPCFVCTESFVPPRRTDGSVFQTKICDKCRPIHGRRGYLAPK
jgi:group I intron endonuclease